MDIAYIIFLSLLTVVLLGVIGMLLIDTFRIHPSYASGIDEDTENYINRPGGYHD